MRVCVCMCIRVRVRVCVKDQVRKIKVHVASSVFLPKIVHISR